jgi:sensor histidine kinase regulating citrate/malate metabolism
METSSHRWCIGSGSEVSLLDGDGPVTLWGTTVIELIVVTLAGATTLRPLGQNRRAPGPGCGPRGGEQVPRHVTLAGQLLALQLLIVLGVLAGVTAVSIAQSGETTRRTESRRALSSAENVAANPLVRQRLPVAVPLADDGLPAAAEGSRALSGARSVLLVRTDGTVVTSADPAQVGRRLPLARPDVVRGRSWTGLVDTGPRTVVAAQVPVFAPSQGRIVGVAVVERDYPSVLQRWRASVPNLVTYLGIAGGLGVLGSLLLARRVKRQTLGLEPQEITRLVEHREAMLHGVKEGLVGLDPEGRVTLINDSACVLLNLPYDCVGSNLTDLPVDAQLRDVLTGRRQGTDLVSVVGDRVLTMNRKPMTSRGRVIGSVTTLRDRTELSALRHELGVVQQATDTLRAQTHEFANQLHVISGLVQLQEYDDVVRFIDNVTRGRAALNDEVASRVSDPALTALLVAKASLAAERQVTLRFAEGARLGRVDDDLSVDLTTVVGNLVDNALDAVAQSGRDAEDAGGGGEDGTGRWVEVDVREDGPDVVVVVRDSGPGVAAGLRQRVFERGFTTKDPGTGSTRGFGLALTGLVCRRRGGDVSVSNDGGAVFTARLPRAEVPA